MRVMVRAAAAIPHDAVAAAHESEAVGLDARERLCCGAGGAPAFGTMTIEGVFEAVGHFIGDQAAQARSSQGLLYAMMSLCVHVANLAKSRATARYTSRRNGTTRSATRSRRSQRQASNSAGWSLRGVSGSISSSRPVKRIANHFWCWPRNLARRCVWAP